MLYPTHQRLKNLHIPPPLRDRGIRQRDGQEDNNRADDQPRIKRCREEIVVMPPPAGPSLTDVVVEQEADERPHEEIKWRGRW